jgi:RNA polymerase sigma-70 factor (ECF subfamily)
VNAGERQVEDVYRRDYGRILATLIRLVGDFDAAEDALQEAFATALARWPRDGVPHNPASWIISTARHKAIDQIRRRAWLERRQDEIERHLEALRKEDDEPVAEDRLRLVFTCCHPALAMEARVALTLRTLCGLTTEEIARAFLVPVATLAQRLVRAKAKIRDAGIPYRVPADDVLPERLDAVMAVVYLAFNEGYSASFGDRIVREDLCGEAVRLGRMLVDLIPARREPRGLLALMLLHDARRTTRVDEAGRLLTLEQQDRTRWDRGRIAEGAALVEEALRGGPPSAYAVQAAIAALHCQAPTPADTDWRQIAGLYEVLLRIEPSPVVELNRAVAVAMADGLERGLELIDRLDGRPELARYHLLPAARADLLRRMGRRQDAAAAYRIALGLVTNQAERSYLEGRLAEVETAAGGC